jgi:two-component system cell cycle response regulator DivK
MAIKILYVEDNKMNFLLVKKILSIYNVDVLHAEDGNKAVKIAEAEKPTLVLMDLHLPGLDGFQVADQIRTREGLERVPILALTASVMQADRDAAQRAGFEGYIEKPLDVKFLVSEIERVLGVELS